MSEHKEDYGSTKQLVVKNMSRNVLIYIDKNKIHQRMRNLISGNIYSSLNRRTKSISKRGHEFATERNDEIVEHPYSNSFKPLFDLSLSTDSVRTNRKINSKYKQNQDIMIEMEFLRKNKKFYDLGRNINK